MKNIIGICNLHDGPNLGLLTENRPLGAVTFLGRYGLMDFALSNLSNSDIDRISVLVQSNVRAIRSHVRDGQAWINNTKTGYLRLFFNEKGLSNPRFNTDIANIIANQAFFEEEKFDYVLITNPFVLSSCDFRPFIEAHIASGAEISAMYRHVLNAHDNYLNCSEYKIDADGKVKSISMNAGVNKIADISLGSYVFTRAAFEKVLRFAKNVSLLYSLRQMIQYCVDEGLISLQAYKFNGYVAPIFNLNDYVARSFELLNYETRQKLFLDDWPIYTVTHNTPPALYGLEADVENSFIANGCIIKGKVHNSIISRDVIIEKGAVVENSIIFTKSLVGNDTKVRYVLADKNVKIKQCQNVSGEKEDILVIEQGANI